MKKDFNWVRLGECATKIGSGLTPLGGHAAYQKKGIPLIRSQNVHLNRFEKEGLVHISTFQDERMSQSRVLPDDVLLNITGASIGRVCVVPKEVCPANVNQHVCIIRLNKTLDPHFVSLFLSSGDFQNHINNLQSGATRQALTKAMIEQFLVPCLPLPTQCRIAAQLKEQLEEVDCARAAMKEQLDAAKALPAASLRAVFCEKKGGRQVALGDVLTLRKDVVHPRDQPHGRATFVGLEHVESGTGSRLGSVEMDLSTLTGRKPRFFAGDIVYGYLRPYLNKVWVGDFDGLCSVDQYVYKVDERQADTEFVAFFMRSSEYLDRAPIGITPGQLPRIRTQEVAQVPLALPPLPVQRALAARLRSEIAAATELRAALEQKLATLDRLPAALLRQVFGEVNVSDG